MTIATAISSALSGLSARSREAGVVSGNIANATTEGYARREVALAARASGGVSVQGVRRAEDVRLSADLRVAEAGRGAADVSGDALRRVEAAIGSPEEPGSLGARVVSLEAALTDAAADPASEARLRAVAAALEDLVQGARAASGAIEATRTEVEAGIDADVRSLNEGLSRVAELNGRIAKGRAVGRDVNDLLDLRRGEVDAVARIAPVRAYERQDGMLTLVAEGGTTLLESVHPVVVEFTASGLVTAEMELGAGSLSPVSIRGAAIDPSAPGGKLSGGTLGARLALRDTALPEAQSRLDAFAGDLAARLGPGGPDATLAPGDAGLLTDAGGPLAAPPVAGLAGRLAVNPAVVPPAGDLWRLRDGLGAAAPGPSGRSDLLRGLGDVLSEPRSAPAGFAPGARGTSGLLADVLSGVASARLGAEARGARAAASSETLRQEERAGGVDTDAELQRLMEIERGYAAGARVLRGVDEMLARLLEI